ncbi:MAG: hypothetical protein K9M45_12590 [Kiritimatiellales bacterium]|nr:hypothetical protein [Kiritimatiellales bacterium]
MAVVFLSQPLSAQNDGAWREQRRRMAQRPRRIILNNDGGEAHYFPRDQEPTAENFLALRTSPLAGSQVDSVFYCSISSGFSYFTHHTEVGSPLIKDNPLRPDRRNISSVLYQQGTDPLRAVLDWCHANGRECFWSMRMNDTHDGVHTPETPHHLFPPLKSEHPEYLLGTLEQPPQYGKWTSVDYGLPVIRDLAFRYIEEVCRNYDVDGVELDFFRHLAYFRSTAAGQAAAPEEREAMTQLIRCIRAMVDREGRRRGRPILLAVRVPDAPDYCHWLGLDLETWLKEDLLDLVTGGGYFRLRPWKDLVKLGHKHGVQVCAGLSESRVKGETSSPARNSVEGYRARALSAWQAGIDSIYLFNYFHPEGEMLRELGDPALLESRSRVHFAAVRNGNAERYVPESKRFQTIGVITPENPVVVPFGQTRSVSLNGKVVWNKGDALAFLVRTLEPGYLNLSCQGTVLEEGPSENGWRRFPVSQPFRPGEIQVDFEAKAGAQRPDGEWTASWNHTENLEQPWYALSRRVNTVSESRPEGLLLADRGTESGNYIYWAYPWNVDPSTKTVAEARVRVCSGWNNVIVCNGTETERVCLYPDRIALYYGKQSWPMDTTDAFHTYRIELKEKDIRVYVDDVLRLDGTGKFRHSTGRNTISFGAANSPGMGEALWQSLRFRAPAQNLAILDLALAIDPATPEQ